MDGKKLGKNQYGVWLDTHYASVVGRENLSTGAFVVKGHVGDSKTHNSGGHKAHKMLDNHTDEDKFFKQIAHLMQNAEEIHLTGTGITKDHFAHWLEKTPQFKHATITTSTSNAMTDTQLEDYIDKKLNW